MARISEIYDAIDRAAPFASAMEFDNVGLLVGDPSAEAHRVLLALDITPQVIEEAAAKNCNLIISHHPVIFTPMRDLKSTDIPYLLAKHSLSAICCHTNLDISPHGGVNVALCEALGLKHIRGEHEFGEGYLIYSGELTCAMKPEEFAEHVKTRLGVRHLRFKAGGREIKKVCVAAGQAGEWAEEAAKYGDVFVCGEIKHHEELIAARLDITVIAAGHYETERIYEPMLCEYLKNNVSGTGFIISEAERPPMEII